MLLHALFLDEGGKGRRALLRTEIRLGGRGFALADDDDVRDRGRPRVVSCSRGVAGR